MGAKVGDSVKVSYIGSLENGEIFDQSKDGETLDFTLGNHEMIPGFENAVIGMEPGETKKVIIEASQAYGERNDEAVVTITRSRLPDTIDPAVGMRLQVQDADGNPFIVTTSEVTSGAVTLDANQSFSRKRFNL